MEFEYKFVFGQIQTYYKDILKIVCLMIKKEEYTMGTRSVNDLSKNPLQ